MATDNAAKGRRPMMYACMTPPEFCNGKKSLEKTTVSKGHVSHEQCRACSRAYLLKTGHVQVGTREFRTPIDPVTGEGGEILVLDKKPGRMKPGKVAGGYMAQSLKVRASAAAGDFTKQKALTAEEAKKSTDGI